jgi:hypothetical protein
VIIDVAAIRPAGGVLGQDVVYGGVVMLREPAIEARVTSTAALALGSDVAVRLVEADPARRMVRFEIEGEASR